MGTYTTTVRKDGETVAASMERAESACIAAERALDYVDLTVVNCGDTLVVEVMLLNCKVGAPSIYFEFNF